jgi:hypothetical protein
MKWLNTAGDYIREPLIATVVWFADNSAGSMNSLANKVVVAPDVYGAIRQQNAYRLIPFSTWYYDFYKSPTEAYALYKAQGQINEDALGLTIVHHAPFLSTFWGAAEMGAGCSSRPGEVGKQLTPGDYITRMLDIGRDVVMIGLATRGSPGGTTPTRVKVTSWAERGKIPDLNPGRWVQLGGPTVWNYLKTGMWGGKFGFKSKFPWMTWKSSNVPFSNYITGFIEQSRLVWPTELGLVFDLIKGLLGQRKIE